MQKGSKSQSAKTKGPDENKTLKRIGAFLVQMLQVEYEKKNEPINGLTSHDALSQLNSQVISYAKGSWPFNRSFNTKASSMDWWENLSQHPDAMVLAVCGLFSVVALVVAQTHLASCN